MVRLKGEKFIGGAEGDRTPDLRIANAALCQTELLPHGPQEYRFEFRVSSLLYEAHTNPQITQIQSTAILCEPSGLKRRLPGEFDQIGAVGIHDVNV